MDGWYPGGVKYRAVYVANNQFTYWQQVDGEMMTNGLGLVDRKKSATRLQLLK